MWETIVTALGSSAITLAALSYFGRSWFEARLRASIDLEYKKQFELFQREINRKEKIELVAELLAEYMKTPHGEIISREQRLKLNKLSFQASLWLPSPLAVELAKRLQNRPDAKSPFNIVLIARKALIGEDGLTEDDITWWNLGHETNPPPVIAR